MMLKMARQGVFWTVQGEGYYAGEPMVFVRLAGCSVGCEACDTNYAFSVEASPAEVVAECVSLRQKHVRAKYVWVTGGEPTDQNLSELNKMLWEEGFFPCIATSGVREVDCQWWWISVSPHANGFKQRHGAELKLVPGLNGLNLKDIDLSDTDFGNRYVQPMTGTAGRESLEQCLEWLSAHRDYKMCSQSHKQWGLA